MVATLSVDQRATLTDSGADLRRTLEKKPDQGSSGEPNGLFEGERGGLKRASTVPPRRASRVRSSSRASEGTHSNITIFPLRLLIIFVLFFSILSTFDLKQRIIRTFLHSPH